MCKMSQLQYWKQEIIEESKNAMIEPFQEDVYM